MGAQSLGRVVAVGRAADDDSTALDHLCGGTFAERYGGPGGPGCRRV